MLRTRSDRLALTVTGLVAALFAVGPVSLAAATWSPAAPLEPAGSAAGSPAAPAWQATPREADQAGQASRLLSSEVNLSRNEAVLRLGFEGGRTIEFAIRDGRMFADGNDLGPIAAHGAGERAWRDLLGRVMDASTPQLAGLLRDWSAPQADRPLKSAIVASLSGQTAPAAAAPADATPAVQAGSSDTLAKLETRLEEMQQRLQQLQDQRAHVRPVPARGSDWAAPFRQIWRGFSGVVGTLVVFAILLGLGVATVFFGGRPHLEAVADAARHYTARSWLVGLAASFLVLPVYILGALALTISLVGIPVLIAWVPLFPVAVIAGLALGYLGVAHASGEALAERRLYGGEWFSRGNSYYFLMTGLGLLLAFFLAAHVVEMAGAWLGFIRGLLFFLGGVTTWFALTTGLGAVLLTRAGTRPITGLAPLDTDVGNPFGEDGHV